MEAGRTDRQPPDTDSQDSRPVPDFSEGQPTERPVTPAAPAAPAPAPAAIPMKAFVAITQSLKLSNTGNRTEIRLPSFSGEGNLTLFLKQFEDVADANGWTPK